MHDSDSPAIKKAYACVSNHVFELLRRTVCPVGLKSLTGDSGEIQSSELTIGYGFNTAELKKRYFEECL